ncbi:Flp pilus assembly protein TadG [Bosea sp. LC85]|uniref:TadE/TadG family type IV pilus assembly protein n=1 Tax=Bosea sp. LC85 TaxID=1502851 RepID=UPI0004E43E12|nr:TadE/TadG family type IV pilus assembly protein [Bosea sp. LC85]KFC65212.1 Flp pilus assembly protein TadG [Bosea sp. LC85]
MKPQLARKFWRSETGVSAVEFAFIAPVMLIVTLGIADVSSYLSIVLQMRATTNTAASFLMQGATDDASTAAAALSSWSGRPGDAQVTLQRTYKCADAVASAPNLCSDGKQPAVFVTIRASGTWAPPVDVNSLDMTQLVKFEQIVRTR